MDSLLRKYHFVHDWMQTVALSRCGYFLCVNPIITKRLRAAHPAIGHKIKTTPTWANPDIFTVTEAFPLNPFRVVFCGRLDKVKRPDLMFRAIHRLAARIRVPVELNLVGPSDPGRFSEFSLVKNITRRHGSMDAKGVHSIIAGSHCGILTSDFEGLPRFVLECLSSGRPVVATALPQLADIIRRDINGYLVEQINDDQIVDDTAHALEVTYNRYGTFAPTTIADSVRDYRPGPILRDVFALHRSLSCEQ